VEILQKSISPHGIYDIAEAITEMNAQQTIEIAYYMWDKLNVPWEDILFIQKLSSFKENTSWVSIESFTKIREIMLEKHVTSISNPKRLQQLSFLATLESQCVMRNLADLIKSKEISDSILLLSYADDGCIAAATMIHDRLVNAYLISYDLESIGSPLLSKRERALLIDILKSYNKKVRKPKLV
jgi:hypothetical protein